MIYFIGGKREKHLAVLGFGLTDDPNAELERLAVGSPYHLTLLGTDEKGSTELLTTLQNRFRVSHLNGPWYRATPDIKDFAKHLGRLRGHVRVSLDLSPEEFAQMTEFGRRKKIAKAVVLRRAWAAFQALSQYADDGFVIQVTKGPKTLRVNLDQFK